MIKKRIAIAFLAASLFALSCNSTADKQKETTENKTTTTEVNPAEENKEPAGNTDVREAALGYCDCFNQNFKNIDPKIKNVFIKAAESKEPLMVLQTELMNIGDEAEQKRLGDEMQKFSNSREMENCTKKLEQKYKVNENDKATQQQVLNALEGNKDCEFVAALMKIGIYQAERATNNPEGQ
jgi:hypothetical protein